MSIHRVITSIFRVVLVGCAVTTLFFSLPMAQAQANRPLRWERSKGLNGGRADCFAEMGRTVFAAGAFGGALYGSTDSGKSWRLLLNLPAHEILVNGATVFMGGNNGFFRSTDSGKTWSSMNVPGRRSGIRSLAAIGSTIIAGTEFDGMFRSRDNGATWTQTNSGIPTPTSTAATYFINTLLVNRNTIIAGADNGGGIFRSTDSGSTWIPVVAGLRDRQARSVRALAIRGTQFIAAGQGGVHTSDDDGRTWNIINFGLAAADTTMNALANVGGALYAGTASGQVYRLNGETWVNANFNALTGRTVINTIGGMGGALWLGTNADIFRLPNNTSTWEIRSTPAVEIRSVILSDATLFAGSPGSGVFRSTDNGNTWAPSRVGMTEFSCFAMAANGSTLFAGTSGAGVARSTTNGISWETIRNGHPTNQVNALGVFNNIVYSGTQGGGIFRSTNNGSSWRAANGGIPTNTAVQAFAQLGSAIYAGTDKGVFLSLDNGNNWLPLNGGVQAGTIPRNVYGLLANGSALFAGEINSGVVNGRGVFRTTDNGASWTLTNLGLPLPINVYSFVEYGGAIYIGTSRGVYRTLNNGDSWVAVNDGFSPATTTASPSVFVFSLAVCGTGLFAGTALGPEASGLYQALPPTVGNFSPRFAVTGSTVTLFGTNFTSVSSVSIAGARVPRFTIDSPTQITATVPTPSAALSSQVLAIGKISVMTESGLAISQEDFTIVPPTAASTQLVAIDPVDFGRVTLRDGGATRLVKVYNVSGRTIRLKPAVLTNSDDFSFAIAENVTTDFTLLSQDFALVAVRFNPLTATQKSATLSITASTEGGQNITARAVITGRGAPLKVFPVNFGTAVTGKGLAVPALVANYGTRTARLTTQKFQNGNQGMSVGRTQSVFLSPGDTTAVLISALQLTEGQFFDTLRVEADIDTVFAPAQVAVRKSDTTDIFVQMGLRAVPDSATPGSPVTLELFIRGEENFSVLQQRNAPFSGSIRYDSRVLYIQPNQSRTEIARNSEAQNTFQRAKILLTPWDGKETTLMKIPTVAMLSDIDSTELVVENITWNDPSGTNNVFVTAPQNGRFKVILRRFGGNRLLKQLDNKPLTVTEISPNPANDAVRTAFSLKEAGNVTLALYNTLGNMVLSLSGKEYEAGNYTVNFSTANLSNGVYSLRLTSRAGTDQTTLVIHR